MAILSSDTFSRANNASSFGTATDGETWAAFRGTPTWSVSSNEGLYAASVSGTFTVSQLGSKTNGIQEGLVRLKPGTTSSSFNIGVCGRISATNNFYYGVLVGQLRIGKCVNNSFSTLVSTAFSYSTANFYWLRFRMVGTSLFLKIWQDGTVESGATTLSTTDTALSSGGWGVGSDTTSTSNFDNFSVTDTHILICDGMGGVFS